MDTLGRPLSFHQQHPNNRESWVERAYGQDQPVASRSTLDVSRPAESPRISPSPGMTRTSSDYPSGSKYQALGGPWSHSARNSYLNPDSPQFSAVPLSGGEARPLSYPSQRSQAGEIDATSREHLDSPATQRPAESEEGTEGAAGGKTRSSTRNSDGSVTVNGTPRSEGKRELERPSEKAFTRAAMANTIAANEQHAAHYRLATSGGQEPDGWTSVPPVSPKYHIHHKELSKERKQAMKKAVLIYGFITLWLWGCLSFFWGSNYLLEDELHHLPAWYIDFDDAAGSYLGPALATEVQKQQALPGAQPHLGWVQIPASDFPNGLDDVQRAVIGQKCWVAVVVNANATSAWRNALESGDASYDPNDAIAVYWQSARFYQVVLLYFPAIVGEFLSTPLSTARGQALQAFTQNAQNNANAINLARQVPQAVGTIFGYYTHDLRPIPNSAWSSAAPMEASLIYFLIFSFVFAMSQTMARMKTGLGQKLTTGAILGLRFGSTLVVYLFLALWETLIIRAFQVPLETYFGRGGFPILWALNYVTIIACGWALETVVCIIGPQFLPFFLTLWIIINITSSFYPLELMNGFYQWLQWAIFKNNVEAYKIIVFGTNFRHVVAKHFGIILGVVGVEVIGLTLAILFERWKQDRDGKRAQIEKE